jgi:hypothetical protein
MWSTGTGSIINNGGSVGPSSTGTGTRRLVGGGSGSSLRTSARMQLMNDTSYGPSVFPSGVSTSLSLNIAKEAANVGTPAATATATAGGGGSTSSYNITGIGTNATTRSMMSTSSSSSVVAAALAGEAMLRSPLPPSSSWSSYESFRRHRSEASNAATAATAAVAYNRSTNNNNNILPIISNASLSQPARTSSATGTTTTVTAASIRTVPPLWSSYHDVRGHMPLSDDDMRREAARVLRCNKRRDRRNARRLLPRHTFRSPLAAKPDRVHKVNTAIPYYLIIIPVAIII